jgi:phosphotransferase system enzyme I (PtsI)
VQLTGIGVSGGIAVGQALIVEREIVPVLRLLLPPDQVGSEIKRLLAALDASRRQLQAIKERLSREVGPHAYIFDAHLLMLDDPLLRDRTVAVIREEHVNAEWALRKVAEQLHALFDEFTDAYLRERSTDLDDVLGRILLNLGASEEAPSLSRLPGSVVLVASELAPSQAAELDWQRVLGLIIDAGSLTYHTSILARSFGVPAVVGLRDATRRIPPGALVVVDGTAGQVVVEPSGRVLQGFREVQERDRAEEQRLQELQTLPAVTRDGVAVTLRANVEFPDEAKSVRLFGGCGIGLFRTEYLMGRTRQWPSEEQQFESYRRLLEEIRPDPVTVRTWDVGSEDLAPGGPTSPNPALGERALRLLSRAPGAFRDQLRALLRASAHGSLRIMFPFVAGPRDWRLALDFLQETRDGLAREGHEVGKDVPVGLNLEVPSAALTVDLFAREVAFFSIGTNDLIQYLLAVDRIDPRVSCHYEPLHPAVLRLVRHVVRSVEPYGVPLSVCGEMAADPLHALVLVGLGVRELSISPSALPRVKAALRAVSEAQAREVAEHCLGIGTASEIESILRREFGDALVRDPAFGHRPVELKE